MEMFFCSSVRLFFGLSNPINSDGPALGSHVELIPIHTNMPGIGEVGIAGILSTDEVRHELQAGGEKMDSMLVVVDHEEMCVVDSV